VQRLERKKNKSKEKTHFVMMLWPGKLEAEEGKHTTKEAEIKTKSLTSLLTKEKHTH